MSVSRYFRRVKKGPKGPLVKKIVPIESNITGIEIEICSSMLEKKRERERTKLRVFPRVLTRAQI